MLQFSLPSPVLLAGWRIGNSNWMVVTTKSGDLAKSTSDTDSENTLALKRGPISLDWGPFLTFTAGEDYNKQNYKSGRLILWSICEYHYTYRKKL